MLRYLTDVLPVVLREYPGSTGTLAVRTRHRVHLRHIDINRHMNQAAYPRMAELSRISWLYRSGAWPRWTGRGINPIVASQSVTYRRELKPLQRFEIDNRAVGIDGRLLQIAHTFVVGDRVHATNAVSVLFVGGDGVLDPDAARLVCADLLTDPLKVENWTVAG